MTALLSRRLIWRDLSEYDQNPKASLFLEVQHPQPVWEASQKRSTEASKGEREREGKIFPTFDHQERSIHAFFEAET